MRCSKKDFYEKVSNNEKIQEILRTVTSTTDDKERHRLCEGLEEIISREGKPIVKECIGDEFKEQELIRMGVNGLYGHAVTTSVEYEWLSDILTRYELVYPRIGTDERSYIEVKDFTVEGKKTILDLWIYYTGDEQMDKKIDDMVEALSR